VTNVVNTLTLIDETARVSKVQPAIVLTFIGVNWRTTSAFVPGYVHRCGFSLRNNEGVVDDDILSGAEIPGSMNTAIHLLKSLPWSKCFFFPTAAILHGFRQRSIIIIGLIIILFNSIVFDRIDEIRFSVTAPQSGGV